MMLSQLLQKQSPPPKHRDLPKEHFAKDKHGTVLGMLGSKYNKTNHNHNNDSSSSSTTTCSLTTSYSSLYSSMTTLEECVHSSTADDFDTALVVPPDKDNNVFTGSTDLATRKAIQLLHYHLDDCDDDDDDDDNDDNDYSNFNETEFDDEEEEGDDDIDNDDDDDDDDDESDDDDSDDGDASNGDDTAISGRQNKVNYAGTSSQNAQHQPITSPVTRVRDTDVDELLLELNQRVSRLLMRKNQLQHAARYALDLSKARYAQNGGSDKTNKNGNTNASALVAMRRYHKCRVDLARLSDRQNKYMEVILQVNVEMQQHQQGRPGQQATNSFTSMMMLDVELESYREAMQQVDREEEQEQSDDALTPSHNNSSILMRKSNADLLHELDHLCRQT